MAYWGQIRGIGPPIPVRRFDGVYKPEDEGFNLPDSLFTELINFCPLEYPALTTRPGYSLLPAVSGATRVLGMGVWKGQELHVIFNDGSWRKWTGSAWTTLVTGLDTSAEWQFCNFKGNLADINLIGSNGVDNIKRYDGSSVQDLNNAPAGGNYIDTQFNRLYCAVGNTIHFSALAKPEDWSTLNDAGEITHETNDGETINGLRAGIGNVTVYKPSSTYELYGTGPTSYRLDPIASDIGVTGDKAVTMYDDVVLSISRDGLYRYAGGLRPERDFSEAVLEFIRGMNGAQLGKCVAGNDGRHVYFGIPLGSGAEVNRILQFDPSHGTWYTWDGIAVTHMARVGTAFYMGTASGRVLQMGGTTDNGTAITATAITKPFTAEAIGRKQHWFKLWVTASIPTGSTLSIYVSPYPSGESWTLAKTITASSNMQFVEVLVPTNSIAAANAVRLKIVGVGPVTIHEITRQLRELPMRR